LAVLMPLVAGGLALAWWRGWLPARAWLVAVALQGILVGTGMLAIQTGEAEEDRVERVVPEQPIEAHEEVAKAFVAASGAVLLLMVGGALLARQRAGAAVAALASLTTLAVLGLGVRTGEAGGELVYRHGAAQAYVAKSGALPVAAGVQGRKHVEGDDDD
jgi:hypothetical protein